MIPTYYVVLQPITNAWPPQVLFAIQRNDPPILDSQKSDIANHITQLSHLWPFSLVFWLGFKKMYNLLSV